MPQSKYFKIGYGIILAFLIIYLGSKVAFIFRPLVVLVQTLFFPFLLSGVLYYLFRPVVNAFENKGIPRVISIFVIYLLFVGLITLLIILVGPMLQKQFNNLIGNLPTYIGDLQAALNKWQENPWLKDLLDPHNMEEITSTVTQYISDSFSSIVTNIANFFGIVTSIVLVFISVPFILFYMLKEGEKAPHQVLKLFPYTQRNQGRKILADMDRAISSYIQGQVIVSACVGVLVYIGYLIIGLEYSLLLAFVAMFTNVIPFIGPFIGTIPAVIVAFIDDSPMMVVYTLIVVVVAQQIESNLISPQVMGRNLNIHPLTIILLLLVAGNLAGFFGLLLAVPTYAVLKVVASHTYRLIKLRNWRNEHAKNNKEPSAP